MSISFNGVQLPGVASSEMECGMETSARYSSASASRIVRRRLLARSESLSLYAGPSPGGRLDLEEAARVFEGLVGQSGHLVLGGHDEGVFVCTACQISLVDVDGLDGPGGLSVGLNFTEGVLSHGPDVVSLSATKIRAI